jgi:FKBP-type peptidyl-prolyl cis-trans isomerase 2
MKKVQNGDTVTVNYTGMLEDGTIFDTSMVEGREPIVAKLGEGNLIPGFENGLINMEKGEKKKVTLPPSEAYGDYREDMIQEVPKEQMPGEVEVGISLQADTQYGPINFIVKEVKEETVILDANHPLAGKTLVFDLEVVDFQ